MNFVDEQYIVGFEIGQQSRKIARLGNHRAAGGAKAHAEFLGDDLRQRGLAQSRRTEEEHMVHRFAAPAGGLDEHTEVLARRFLANELAERLGPQRRVRIFRLPLGRMQGDGFSQNVRYPRW